MRTRCGVARLAVGLLARLLNELAEAGCTVRQLHVGRQNLEQLFMRLTRRSLRD